MDSVYIDPGKMSPTVAGSKDLGEIQSLIERLNKQAAVLDKAVTELQGRIGLVLRDVDPMDSKAEPSSTAFSPLGRELMLLLQNLIDTTSRIEILSERVDL